MTTTQLGADVLTDEMLARFDERAPIYDRENRFCEEDIEDLRFWNHDWRHNHDGVLLAIWEALHRRTGCEKIQRKEQNHRFIPPDPTNLLPKPRKPAD